MPKSLSMQQKDHGQHIASRRAINGQDNGYQPISEAQLQREREGKRIVENIGRDFADYWIWLDEARKAA